MANILPAPPLIDAVAGTASLRTLGTGAQQAAAGNDSRFIGGGTSLITGRLVYATGASALANSNFTASGNTLDLASSGAVTLGANSSSLLFSYSGSGAPQYTTRSAGTRLVLLNALSGGSLDNAIGQDASSNMWISTHGNELDLYLGDSTTANYKFHYLNGLSLKAGMAIDTLTGGNLPIGTSTATNIIVGGPNATVTLGNGAGGGQTTTQNPVYLRAQAASSGSQLQNSPALHLVPHYWIGGTGPDTATDITISGSMDSIGGSSHVSFQWNASEKFQLSSGGNLILANSTGAYIYGPSGPSGFLTIQNLNATGNGSSGAPLNFISGAGVSGSGVAGGQGGGLNITGGAGGDGDATHAAGAGANVTITAGSAGTNNGGGGANGGYVFLRPGAPTGTGNAGVIDILDVAGAERVIINPGGTTCIYPIDDITRDLGGNGNRWSSTYTAFVKSGDTAAAAANGSNLTLIAQTGGTGTTTGGNIILQPGSKGTGGTTDGKIQFNNASGTALGYTTTDTTYGGIGLRASDGISNITVSPGGVARFAATSGLNFGPQIFMASGYTSISTSVTGNAGNGVGGYVASVSNGNTWTNNQGYSILKAWEYSNAADISNYGILTLNSHFDGLADGMELLVDALGISIGLNTVVVWTGSKKVGMPSATANLTTVAGIYVGGTGTAGTRAVIAKRGRCYVKYTGAVSAGDIVVTSGTTAGFVQTNNAATAGAMIGHATEAGGSTVAGYVQVDLLL